MLLLEPGRAGPAWRALAQELPRPQAILAVSAHWNTRMPAVSATAQPETIHDFYGFPQALYELDYPAPGAPDLAAEVATLVPGIQIDHERGLDHGAWSPLRAMYPAADIPVIQFAVMPQASAGNHYRLGRMLQPLTQRGVLVLASGGLTHNLRDMVADAADGEALPYVSEFRDWFVAALEQRDLPALLDWRRQAPHAARAHPSPEHLLPLYVALGAAGKNAVAHTAYRDSQLGALALDAFVFAADGLSKMAV
ncbi:MAG: extradiol ring-cleavage dioxygenase class III protein subunit B [Rhodocyclaceae bacterium]|nr:MAG: extradiol ring-cleavage dioxygenase class III protein subunit B [Rhodocyclaceae bacterium]TND00528.1 MAG: extradiol ring-cleavage dioxygenase class III protein subunit B [Rhodocyclaceae bacterium]